jgi:uncharacterized membrane protein YdjX (TVP38/TMEM64 family)
MKRIWLLIAAVMLIPIIPWLLVGAPFEGWVDTTLKELAGQAERRELAATLGVVALAGDSFLPVPSTIVMSALGLVFGVFKGGLLASGGLFLSGLIAYGGCRWLGAGLARRIAGEKGMEDVKQTMTRLGPWVIAITRSVPVIQEATACLAGLSRMPLPVYCCSLAAGCLPTGFAYAAVGAAAVQSEGVAIALSVALPALTWPLIYWLVRRRPASVSSAS